MKHEKSYLEEKAREMGQQVRRINETCRKGVQRMSITVPPIESGFVRAIRYDTRFTSYGAPYSPPLAPRNPDTF